MTISKKGKFVFFVIAFAILVMVLELLLRVKYGFCDTVLMREDIDYEYIAVSNQDRFRFKNRILYNSLSMRSSEYNKQDLNIFGFGDSVINGGVLTDHDSLGTTVLSRKLSELCLRNTNFLNISAGSWGPDNCFAYLEKNKVLNANAIFLFVSSHDAFDIMEFSKVVGIMKDFPKEQYKWAIIELFDRYLIPRYLVPYLNMVGNPIDVKENELAINKQKDNTEFNIGFENFLFYAKSKNIPFVIYLHAERSELKNRRYNNQGIEIIDFCVKNNIPIIKDLELGLEIDEFRDDIHINNLGQRKLANRVLNFILSNPIDI
ncbi:MAG TPA: hypothetical protein PLZ32_17160 [Saprospiraceae bacterium]|nr:hypothetical protein [Saprospiraceae bacterium]